MLLKESARILCSSYSCPHPWPQTHHYRQARSPKRGTLDSKWNNSSACCYASASDIPFNKRSSGAAEGYVWPTSVNPTPYEILAHPKDAPYNKALFYELVKVYHPDMSQTAAHSSIPHSTRLERYRQVVAANEILSDSAKRRAYDLYGAGWGSSRTLQSAYREADRSWRSKPGNASRNATWEDWEKWRHERDGQKRPQSPVFMSNELFIFVLCSFVVVGSFTQARRASSNSLNIIDMRDQKHATISGGMRRRQDEQAPLTRHERVENFLRQRESWNIVSSGDRGPQSPS